MFAKLLKHEWKDSARLLGILTLCALATGPLGGALIRILTWAFEASMTDDRMALLIVGFIMLLIGLMLALFLYSWGTQMYLFYRFYKTRFTDQGYLTFTLPAGNRSIFLSAYVHILIWVGISTLTVFAAIATAAAIGCAGHVDMAEIQESFRFYQEALEGSPFDGYGLLQFVGILISSVSSVMIAMACITVGAVVAKKLKLLAAFGIYYGQSIAMATLASVLQLVATFATMGIGGFEENFYLASYLTYVVQALWAVGAYFLSMHLINKKLNLP